MNFSSGGQFTKKKMSKHWGQKSCLFWAKKGQKSVENWEKKRTANGKSAYESPDESHIYIYINYNDLIDIDLWQ